ncbi:SLAP domain-containing protein [Companilactobacillus keshanensis]|uniref:SLAP domain-containing protein n=1 Tax=Companilactobacillus keshanensis TaxID=2486003 RepID=A0ABW4BUG2_9LACO|nr:SLAP domain-containing protein [Companilactobacillus keshanensis]
MKFRSKSVAIIAALAMATTGAVTALSSTTQVDAATVATVHAGVTARLYTADGVMVSNRALAPSTPWQVGKTATINGETMYQVSTDEYLRASDSTLTGQDTPAPTPSSTLIATVGNKAAPLYLTATKGDPQPYSELGANTSWKVSRVVTNGTDTFYEVSLGVFIKATDSSLNMTPTNVETYSGFTPYLGYK